MLISDKFVRVKYNQKDMSVFIILDKRDDNII